MKIRIKGNSLRYRLTKTDDSKLPTMGSIEVNAYFGDQPLIYSLKTQLDGNLCAQFENNE